MKRTFGTGLGIAALALALAGCGGGNSTNTPVFQGQRFVGLTANNQIVEFGAGNSQTTSSARTLSGLQSGERVLGIDFRPNDGTLFALGSTSRLYRINVSTGVATAVGSPLTTPLNGTRFGFDFNPTVDRIRIVSDTEQNLRVNPDTGAATVDGNLQYATGDVANGQNPAVSGVGYTNSVAGATTTALFGIDAQANTLVSIAPPNDGTLNTIGALGGDVDVESGLEIVPNSNDAIAILRRNDRTGLYRINLATGAATLINPIADGTGQLIGLASVPTG